MHGRLTAKCARFTCLLHVSLDPYNTTEEMELTWTDLVLDWTNGKLDSEELSVTLIRRHYITSFLFVVGDNAGDEESPRGNS